MHNRASNVYTGVYRSKDCINNFNIRIRLEKEKFSLVALHEDHEDDGGRKIEERKFSWQEKVFSLFEASYYKFSGNCHTPLEEKYHEDVTHLWENGPPTNRLFTYTDVDKFTDEEVHAHPVFLPEDSALRHSTVHSRRRHRWELYPKHNIVDYNPNEDTRRKNRTLQNDYQTFYILADLSTASITEEVDWAGKSEYILCTVRWDSTNGVLTVTPDFSPEPYLVEVDEDSRSLYCYWVIHDSSDITLENYNCEKQLLDKLTDHHMRVCQLQIGSDFEMPQNDDVTVFIMGEITSTKSFEADQLCIYFVVELPKGWSCDEPELLKGVTHVCRTNRDDVANFGYTFQLKLSYSLELLQIESDILVEWPQMFMEVMSCDSWGRSRTEGYGSIRFPATPGRHYITVPTWRPEPVSVVSQLRRFFLGDSFELLSLTHCSMSCNFQDRVVNKYGLSTVTSGNVMLCISVVHQSHVLAGQVKSSQARNMVLMERLSAATLVNSVNSVLLAFRRAREHMLKARSSAQVT